MRIVFFFGLVMGRNIPTDLSYGSASEIIGANTVEALQTEARRAEGTILGRRVLKLDARAKKKQSGIWQCMH